MRGAVLDPRVQPLVNLLADPQGTSWSSSIYRWWPFWFGGSGGTGTNSNITAADAPMGLPGYVRKTWTTSGATGATGWGLLGNGRDTIPGRKFYLSGWMRTSASDKPPRIYWEYYDSAHTRIASSKATFPVLVPGVWARLSATNVVPAGAAQIRVGFDMDDGGTAWAPGDTLDGTGVAPQGNPLWRFSVRGRAQTGSSPNATPQPSTPKGESCPPTSRRGPLR